MAQRLTACEGAGTAVPAPSFGGLHSLAVARCFGGRAIHRRSKDGAGTTPAPRPGSDCRAARRSLRQTATRKLLFERNKNETILFRSNNSLRVAVCRRSEEHTSELQSPDHLV